VGVSGEQGVKPLSQVLDLAQQRVSCTGEKLGISMLADPNGNLPANVDAVKEWREDRNGEFKRKVAHCVRKSQETAFE
jgi:hypothetical protein